MVANEVVGNLLRSRGEGVMCKVDIEKTYVSWSFALYAT